jgi:Protein of unknown function (DUF3995)
MRSFPHATIDRRIGYAAWIWVVVFTAFHVYWYAGGQIGHPQPLPEASVDVFNIVVGSMFVVGAVVPLAATYDWGRAIPRRALLAVLWAGAIVLLLRGGAGIVDETLRATGVAPNGLTGMSREQVSGSAHPSAHVLWSGRITDVYFAVGGVLFGIAARAYEGATRDACGRRPNMSSRPGSVSG